MRKTGVKGNRLIVPNTDGIGGGVEKKIVEGNGLIVSNTDVVIEGEVGKKELRVAESHQIRHGGGIEKNKRRGGTDSSYQIRMSMVVVISPRHQYKSPLSMNIIINVPKFIHNHLASNSHHFKRPQQ